jgi:integrase
MHLIAGELLSNSLYKMTFSIIVKKPGKSGLSRLYLFCRINGKPCSVPTKIKIKAGTWDAKNKKIKSTMLDHERLNGLLTKRKAQLQQVFDDLEYEGIEPSIEGVKLRYSEIVNGKKKDPVIKLPSKTVADLLFSYEKDYKNIRAKGYLRKFGTFARHINTWGDKGGVIEAEHFGAQELNKYINDYLVDELELSNNSIHDHVKKIRLVMEKARGVPVHPDHVNFFWKYQKVKPIWLDWSEVELIEKLVVLEEHQDYKDEFLFRCYTGLRWSDCHQLKPVHFIKNGKDIEIDITVIKTQMGHNLLLSSKAAALAEKWEFKVPALHISDCNEKIKDICRAAKINRVMEKVRYSGSKRTVEMFPKWKLITTHVARRSFGRSWMDRGGDLLKLCKYYGHSDTQQTIDYIGYEAKEINAEMKRLFG